MGDWRDALDEALRLGVDGISVFPCCGDKSPACRHGFYDATCEPDRIRDVWRHSHAPLVGVPTGAVNDLAVLDIDVQHDGDAWYQKHFDELPRTRVHETRSGGFHLLFRHRTGLRSNNNAQIARGVDVRADGGYAIWWPAAGLAVLDDVRPAPWPDWLIPPERMREQRAAARTGRPVITDQHSRRGLLRIVAYAHEGERNTTAFWAACRLGEQVRAGQLDRDYAIELIAGAAQWAGLSAEEAYRTARSGINRG